MIKIENFSLEKMNVKMLSAKWWPFCLSLNVQYTEYLGQLGQYHSYELKAYSVMLLFHG